MTPALRSLLVASCVPVALGATTGCRARHRRRAPLAAAHPAAFGPPLGPPSSRVAAVRALNPPRSPASGPFTQVLLVDGGALGVARGRLFQLAAGGSVGDTRAIDPASSGLGEDRVHSIASGGGRVVYAVVAGPSGYYLARSDDAGQHFAHGATIATPEPLPAVPDDPAIAVNPETRAGLAAHERTVVFFQGELALASRDGGATLAPLDLGGVVRDLTVTTRGTVVALVRQPTAAAGDPIAVIRLDVASLPRPPAAPSAPAAPAAPTAPTGVLEPAPRPATPVTVFAPADPCAGAQVFALADGTVLLGGAHGLLGQCARRSRDDGRTFAPLAAIDPAATASLRATSAGAVLVRPAQGDALSSPAAVVGRAFVVPVELLEVAHDVAPDGTVAVGLRDGLALGAATETLAGTAALRAEIRGQPRGALAFAAARDVLATMNAHGTITLLEPSGDDGTPRVRTIASPCRFAPDAPTLRDLALLGFDGRGRVCCASQQLGASTLHDDDAAPGVQCASLAAAPVSFAPLETHAALVGSGQDAIAVFDPGAACLAAGSARPATALGLADTARVLELACAARGDALANTAASAHVGVVGFATPFELVAGASTRRTLAPATGLRPHLFARADGSVIAAIDTDRGLRVRLYPPRATRFSAEWAPQGPSDRASVIAPWDERAAVLSVRRELVVVGPGAIAHRAFAGEARYDAVARVGAALVGVTSEGSFYELAARAPSP